MIRSSHASPRVPQETLAAFLNSSVADRVFRCLSGSVAVSAYELEAIPLPPASQLDRVTAAIRRDESRLELDRICAELYGVVQP
jgi:adenine-specific DNA-methyltransferase